MTTNRILPQEDCYRDAPITTRLAPALARIESSPLTLITAGLLLAFGCFLVGWYARGLLGVVYDNRGWAALLVFSIAGSTWMVNQCNREVHSASAVNRAD